MASPLVWFKRDLRVHDHAAVHEAIRRAPARPWRGVYIVEPSVWAQPDASARQFGFVMECLADLQAQVQAHGGSLAVLRGEACEVLARLHADGPAQGRIESLDETDLGALLRVTQLLVNEAQEQGLATGLRTCLGCEFFRPFASGERDAPHVCAFLGKAFGDAELRVDCPEQRPADDARRSGSVVRFRQQTAP